MLFAMTGAAAITAGVLTCNHEPKAMIGMLIAGVMMIIIGAANNKQRA